MEFRWYLEMTRKPLWFVRVSNIEMNENEVGR